jgi:adenine phosphoribosyltransferase
VQYDHLKDAIRNIPDYPKPGIMFRDITTLLRDPKAYADSQTALADYYRNVDFDLVLGIEARGFMFGGALAIALGKGFVPMRKSGKLPSEVVSESYTLEYGEDTINMHADAVLRGQRVVVIDDLLATGGTMRAATNLVTKVGGVVAGVGVIIELSFLNGRECLKDYDLYAVINYDSE